MLIIHHLSDRNPEIYTDIHTSFLMLYITRLTNEKHEYNRIYEKV